MDITDEIKIHKADITDNAGGIADSTELVFSDTEGLWSKWKPQKGDKIEVKKDGFFSGIMYIWHIEQQRGLFILKSCSLPLSSKTKNTKSWENIRFLNLSNEIAVKYGFKLETYNIQDYFYERIDQVEQTDFDLLAFRCMLEGYMLKICNKKIIIYDEEYQEQQSSAYTINYEDIDGNYNFKTISAGLFSSCILSCSNYRGILKSEFKPALAPVGPALVINNIYASNQGEINRFARGLLRSENKKETTGKLQIEYNPGLAAGCNTNVSGIGLFDGKYFIETITHKLVDGKSFIKLRKPLEGY